MAVVGPHRDGTPREVLDTITRIVSASADVVLTDRRFEADLSQADPALDFVVVLGGDGSVLRAVRRMGASQRPVLGINLGHLGFLAHLPRDLAEEEFRKAAQGACRIVHHLMLTTTVMRDGQPVARQLGLNEAAILGGPPYSMLEIGLFVDGQWATTYHCDGLIIATPVGSTAHSLSAGGPILRKTIDAFVISPISPHTLTVRPVVDDAHRVYEMVVPAPHQTTAIVVDGQPLLALEPGDRVRIERAGCTFQLIERADQNDYRTLREKLGWHGSLPGRRSQPDG